MLSPSDHEKLVESSTLKEALDILREKYAIHLLGSEPEGVSGIERMIETQYFTTFLKILAISPFGLRQVLRAMSYGQELRILASTLKAIHEGLEPEEAMSLVVPFGDFDEERCRELLETRSVRRAVEQVEDSGLREALLFALSEFGQDRSMVGVELAIGRASARRLWGASLFLTGQDAESVRHILGQRLDLQNLLLVARSKVMGIPPKTIRPFLLPVNYRVGRAELDSMIELPTVREQLGRVLATYYGRVFKGVSPDALARFEVSSVETALDRYLAKECLQSFSGSRFTAGLAVAFLLLKRFETNDLKGIITGKAKGVAPKEIRRNTILHQEPWSSP